MCLETIDKKGKLEDGVGYKVFVLAGKKELLSQLFPKGRLIRNRWLKDYSGEKIYAGFFSTADTYSSGWHIFTQIEGARRWYDNSTSSASVVYGQPQVIHRVRYRKAHTLGKQPVGGGKHASVIVAKEMKILREIV